ncbi:hypothetical protein AB0J74_11680 [Asanoa sp. NPDC049573]|uniref:hypothetical protein n=1 Tax=Asanoa sp. NPDC049573 TaxID=3155396 RepID=UPI003422478D
MATNTAFSKGFFRDKGLDYQARGILGRAVHGGSDAGEVLATIERISDADSWRSAWSATATRVAGLAERSREQGDRRGAGSAFLRAANYWACVVESLSELDDEPALLLAFRAHRTAWEGFVDASDGAHVRLEVPYEGGSLPGFLLRPDASGARRPTLVVTNGSDGSISGLWSAAAAGAVARGWNAFVYDGPGQQSMLFERKTSFRPDWEAVLTPVLDALVGRADVARTGSPATASARAATGCPGRWPSSTAWWPRWRTPAWWTCRPRGPDRSARACAACSTRATGRRSTAT